MKLNESIFNVHWNDKKLSELGCFQRGKSRHRPRNDPKLFIDGKYPLIQTGEVKEANLYIDSHKTVYNDFGLSQSKLWPSNTLCITIAANIAETALLKYPMCFPDSIVGFNAYTNETSEIFMYYIFEYIKRSIQNAATGSIQDNINIEYLMGVCFKIPDRIYQDKITDILLRIDQKIELNNRINGELETMAKTLYDYWFVQFDFPNEEGKPYKSSGGKMVYNTTLKREVPEGWGIGTISEFIASFKGGDWGKETIEGKYTIPVTCVRGADINGLNGAGQIGAPKRYILERNKEKFLHPYDLVIEISGGSPTQSTGRLVLISDEMLSRFDEPLICSNFCKAISLVDHQYAYNFMYIWNSIYDSGVLFGWEGKTSGIKNLLFESFVSKYKICMPTMELVNKFFSLAKDIHKKKQNNIKENENLIQLRDFLLPMLMNGQVTVK